MMKLDHTFMLQMKKEPGYRWWKPIVALVLFIIFDTLLVIPILVIQETVDAIRFGTAFAVSREDLNPQNYMAVDLGDPVSILFNILPFFAILLAMMWALKITKLGGLKPLESTQYKLRFDRLFAYLPLLCLLHIVSNSVEMLINVISGEPLGTFRFPVWSLIVIILLVPIQSATEEYMFRGFVTQALGSWIPIAWLVWILQGLAFMSLHGYNAIGNLAILVSGLFMGLAAFKTGGLEASMAMHITNNVLSFIVSTIFVGNDVKKDITIPGLLIDAAVSAAAYCIVMYVAKKKGYLVEPKTAQEVLAVQPEAVEAEDTESAE